jgi:hypothetical protein
MRSHGVVGTPDSSAGAGAAPSRSLMATAPDNGMLRPLGPAPLGAILVQRGVLTEEQLASALEEQKRTGEQLGEVIVRLGFALAPSVAQALATQHGGPLKTEYGYAVGFGTQTSASPATPPPVSPAPAQERPAAQPPEESALRVAAAHAAAPPTAPVGVAVASAAPVDSAHPTHEEALLRWQQHAQRLGAERDAALQQVSSISAERDATGADLDAMRVRSADLEATTAQLAAELETIGRARGEDARRVTELEQQLHSLQSTAGRLVELEATTTLAEVERAKLTHDREKAAGRSAELERQLAELQRRVSVRTGELEAELTSVREEAARAMTERAALERNAVDAEQRVTDSERRLAALREDADARERERTAAQSQVVALEAAIEEARRAKMETARLAEAHEEVRSRNADLEQQLVDLRAAAVSEDGHLAAATARVAELEAARAAAETETDAELTSLRAERARIEEENVALVAECESLTTRTAQLEDQLQRLEAAAARMVELELKAEETTAQIAQLEAERNDVLAVAKAVGEERRGRCPDHQHADDSSHLLFVPSADGYQLLEQEGPPPEPGSTVEVAEADGAGVRLLVAKVGGAPLPGVRLACAYLAVSG